MREPSLVVDVAIIRQADEALAGHATRIDVRMHADGSVSVDDDGPGPAASSHRGAGTSRQRAGVEE